MNVGVLALQGGFDAHRAMLGRIGVDAALVRTPEALDGLDGLVIPGGESTTLINLMDRDPAWWQVLPAFHERGGTLFGTCAGLILLARGVGHPAQRSLGLLDVDVDRNAYGRQVDSAEGFGTWRAGDHAGARLEMIFIRAPRITRLGPGVEVLATRDDAAVLVEADGVLAASFHPELTDDDRVHRRFLALGATRVGTPAEP